MSIVLVMWTIFFKCPIYPPSSLPKKKESSAVKPSVLPSGVLYGLESFLKCLDTLCVNLTNRFHVAVRLFSNRSQMTSKCGKNKKVAHEAIAECVTDVLTTFSRPL